MRYGLTNFEAITTEDFAKVFNFIGKDDGCFAILNKLYDDKDEFETILKILPKEKRMLANGDTYGNGKRKKFYFVTLPDQENPKGFNCILVHNEDMPVSENKKGVFGVSKSHVYSKMKKKMREAEANAKIENKVEKIIQEETEIKDNKTNGQKKYEDFLQTDYWKMVREIKLQQAENKCQVCGSKNNLNVHHNTYAHHGKEHLHLADLVVLCKDCHSLFHHKLPQEPKKEKTNKQKQEYNLNETPPW